MRPFIIMILVLVEVALWWRVAVTGRGHYLPGAALGGIGAVIQITVVIRLLGEIGGLASIAGYADGVALGVAADGVLDRRATPQMLKVQVIAPSRHELPRHVRSAGWPVTQFSARGNDEDLDVINIAIDDRHVSGQSWNGWWTASTLQPRGSSSGCTRDAGWKHRRHRVVRRLVVALNRDVRLQRSDSDPAARWRRSARNPGNPSPTRTSQADVRAPGSKRVERLLSFREHSRLAPRGIPAPCVAARPIGRTATSATYGPMLGAGAEMPLGAASRRRWSGVRSRHSVCAAAAG